MPTTSIVMLGATGAVGNHAALALAARPDVERLTLLGRRPAANVTGGFVVQASIDVFDAASYRQLLPGHDAAICALGVGEPSKANKADFVRIDRDAVLDFATACREAGVRHFELLGSVGASAASRSFYLRTKGELEDGLKALGFERLSLVQPSMIVTPTNRYGVSQGILLAVMPRLDPLLVGSLRKFRSIHVERLGAAMAANVFREGQSVETPQVETLQWDDFIALSGA